MERTSQEYRHSEQINLDFDLPKSISHSSHSPMKTSNRKNIHGVINLSKSISPSKKYHHSHIERANSNDDQEDTSDKPCHYISSPIFHSFKEYSYYYEQNNKFRDEMEDTARIYDHFMDDPYKSYFALFDGHGGIEVSKYACDHFHTILHKNLQEHKTKIERALKKSF